MLPVNILRILHVTELKWRENIRLQNIERKIMRYAADPFSLRDDQFIGTFRLSKGMVQYVFTQIEPHLRGAQNIKAIPLMTKLLSALGCVV